MSATIGPDRFDEVRREWIAYHQGWSTIQRRRAEQLGRIVRKRQRIRTAAVPDPHDDTVLDPLWIRAKKSTASQVELAVVLLAAAIAPVGWPGGWVLKVMITRQIPQTLCGYPIAALLWSGTGLGLLTVTLYQLVYDPAGSYTQIGVLPWMCVQLTTIPTAAGIYGIAEGWLAVDGSKRWWPLTPVKPRLTAEDAAAILGGYDMTGPGVVDARPLHEPGERTRP
ncbi:hypothetical protein [Mycobacterium intracellulare]|uniref:hypothetical protein n=1 Tax=Mycobacterium intracellulare TaxID=1767 RepID=UPI0006CA7197|nr:hypothetical protein [Mycobacterium intracellulare]KPN47683.1 hypothetical protein AN933_23975 [Mycobacterium intracellulare subsp. chimaera]